VDSCKARLSDPLLQQLLPNVWQALKDIKLWKTAEGSSSSSRLVGNNIRGIVNKEDWPLAVEMGLRVLLVDLVAMGECAVTNEHHLLPRVVIM
jgi:hypothetical protein